MTTTTEVRERGILFSGEMVRAILEGRKTVTRRVIKPQPRVDDCGNFCWNGWNYGQHFRHGPLAQSIATFKRKGGRVGFCPYGAPGDRLWVRETWGLIAPEQMSGTEWYGIHTQRATRIHPGSNEVDGIAYAIYRADGEHEFPYRGWHPSIHMPRWASRITLEITEVRVERLQEINRGDCMAEGCPFPNMADGPDPREWFGELWNSINAGRGYVWDVNPWVWVVSFKRVEVPA